MLKQRLMRLFSIIISIVFILQIIPTNFAFAITPSDITDTQYLTVHGTDYTPSSMASSLTITESDGVTVIDPDINGNYNDIPTGAKIILDYAFTLEDGSEGTLFDYDGNEYFTASLPEGLNFSAVSGTLVASDSTDGNYDLATWTISGNNFQVDLTTAAEDTFGMGGAENDNHLDKWGKIHIEGTFNALSAGDGTTETITFGSQTITINRQPLPLDSTLSKSGIYDASTNQITWTVNITPPAGDPNLAYDTYSIIDEFSNNQVYISDSFTVGAIPVPDTSLTIDSGNRTVSYLYPDTDPDTTGTQTITYKTSPTDFSAENGTSAEYSTYSNTVSLFRGSDAVADDAASSINLNWIEKTGSMVDTSAADPTIAKWDIDITVPGTDGDVVTGARIIDSIPSDLELLADGTHPVTIKFGSNSAIDVSSGVSDGQYTYSGNILTYQFPSSNQPIAGTTARLTFYTKVTAAAWSSYLDTNDPISFSNSATFNWSENTTGTNPQDGFIIDAGIGEGGLLSKSGGSNSTYYYSVSDPGTIHWTVLVNRNNINIVNAKITDIVPADQALLINSSYPLTVTGLNSESITSAASTANFTYTDSNNFSYEFPEEISGTDTISSEYTVDFYTRVIDSAGLSKLYSNGNKSYYNGVTLTSDSSANVSYTGRKVFRSQMLNKSISTDYNYNPADRTVQWSIVVNRNLLPLNNAEISDTLPAGMTLLIDTTHQFSVTTSGSGGLGVLTGASGDSSFTYTLPSSTSDQYTITFWSKLSESALTTQWSGTKEFSNQVSLNSDEIGTPITVSSTANIKNPVISKVYDYTSGSDTITWSVEINNAQVLLQNTVIADTLNPSLLLDPDSIELLTTTIDDSTGEANSGGILVDASTYNITLPTIENGNVMSVALPISTTNSYRLVFQTLILTDDINLSNIIDLTGSAGDPAGSSTSTQIVVNDLYSSGGSGTNTLTVHKVDSTGNPLEGATFRLLNVNKQPISKNGNPITQITNSSGDAVFSSLPSWVFYVEEIDPTIGYLIPEDAISGGNRLDGTETINVTNLLALTDVTFNKTGAGGALLDGGTFTLSGLNYDSIPVSITAAAVNGVVTFSNVMPNLIGEPYTITEIVEPGGHVSTTTTLSASVAYNTSKNALVVTVTPDTLVNTPDTGSVIFTKTGTGGELLNGGSFTLSGTDYTSNTVNITGVSAVNGTVTFPNIPIGNYTITELTPPEGYLMPMDTNILTAVVAYNESYNGIVTTINSTESGTTIVTSYVNTQAFGTLSFTKIDSRDDSEISGGTFTLTGKNYAGNDVLLTSTSVGGTVTFNDVPLGDDYTIKEKTAPSGYRINPLEIKASVVYTEDKTAIIADISEDTLPNDRVPSNFFAQIAVIKTSEEGIILPGAEFTLYNRFDVEIAKAVSGSDGIANFGYIVNGLWYKIKETKAPEGYELNLEELTFSVVSVEPLTYTVVNIKSEVEYGSISILKTDESGKVLSDAEFTLYDTDNKVIDTVITQSDGTAHFNNIPTGSYVVKETRAPLGYVIDSTGGSAEVNSNEVVTLTFINTLDTEDPDDPTDPAEPEKPVEALGNLQVTKIDTDNNLLSNAEFTLYDEDDNIVKKMISGNDGIATFTELVPGKYSVLETTAPEGYELYNVPVEFQINESKQNQAFTLKNKKTDDDTEIVYWTNDNEVPVGVPENPQTGGIPMMTYIFLSGFFLLLAGLALRIRAKRKEQAS